MKKISRHTLPVLMFSMLFIVPLYGDTGTLTGDGAWCWFADPRGFYHDGVNERTYTGWITRAGDIVASQYDHRSNQYSFSTARYGLESDDHDNPTIVMKPDGRIMIFYCRHTADRNMYYRVSSNPEDITSWGPERTVTNITNGNVTYPSVFFLPAENNKLFLFYRGIDWQPTMQTSSDGGESWDQPRKMIQIGERPYIKYESDGNSRIHFAFTNGHPRNEPNNSIYYAYYYNGGYYRADGFFIKQVSAGNLTAADGDKVYDASRGRAWIWDIALDNHNRPVLVYSVMPSETEHYYHYAYYNGSSWQEHRITAAGRWFPETPPGSSEREPHYSGGVILDHDDPAVVYLSRQVNGVFEIEKWRTADNGNSWDSRAITQNSNLSNVRPFVPRNHKPGYFDVLWMQGHYVHYTDYATGIQYYSTRDLPPTPKPTAIPPEAYPLVHSVSSEPEATHRAVNLLDGDLGAEARWSAQGYPQWVIIDYGKRRPFPTFSLYTYNGRSYQYTIEVSDNPGSGYFVVVDRSHNTDTTQPFTDTFGTVSGRYVKITVSGASGYTGDWISLLELTTEAAAQPTPLPYTAQTVLERAILVNDYWIGAHSDPGGNTWDRATYFEGNMALYRVSGEQRYYDYAVNWGNKHNWNLNGGTSTRNADNQTCGQTYIDLYRISGSQNWITNIQTSIDNMVNSTKNDDWWWIDALQMAMPVFTKLGVEKGNTAYFNKMYELYNHTKRIRGDNGLYNTGDALWYRDANYDPPYTEPNGEDCYWSRGNGWVFAGHARVLAELPLTDPHRNEYIRTFQAMAQALRRVQRSDGFWNASLHDPGNYGGKETSGSAFFTYGMAWGMNNGLLDTATYGPVVERAWTGMATEAVHPNGFLGYVQGTGAEPSNNYPFAYSDTTDFGVGAFLLAASEVYIMLSGTSTQTGILGDVNGDGAVNIIDALMVAQFYVGLDPVNFHSRQADTNCSGSIDIVDALRIAQYYVGLISAFC